MEGGPLLQDWWAKVSEEFVPYLNIEARWDGAPDQGMLGEKGGRGFPHCVFMDADGKVLSQTRPSSEGVFGAALKPVQLLAAARTAAAKKGSKKNKRNLALIEAVFDPKQEDLPVLKKAAKKKGIDKEILALFNCLVDTWPIREAMNATDQTSRDPAVRKALGEKLYGFYKSGTKVEEVSADIFDSYWVGVANHAVEAKDKEAGNAAYGWIEKKYKGDDSATRFLSNLRKQIDAI